MKKLKLFLIILFALAFFKAECQWKDFPISVPSANVSNLGKYLEVPVSSFSGLADISVNLYELKGKKIYLPLSLKYQTSGINPEIHPSWVGNGFSLSAGGMITRVSHGSIDELSNSYAPSHGFYYSSTKLNVTDWSSETRLSQTVAFRNTNISPTSLDADVEPDEFLFSFPGGSGRFFLDHTGEWRVQSDKPLKVIFNPQDFISPFTVLPIAGLLTEGVATQYITKTFGKFTIIDETGNQFVFGSTDPYNSSIEFSDNMLPGNYKGSSITATTWFLTQIKSADNTETIDLSYERGPLTSHLAFQSTGTQVTGDAGGTLDPAVLQASNSSGLNGRVIFPVYLKKISMPVQNITIEFNKSKMNDLQYSFYDMPSGAYVKLYEDNNQSPTNTDFPSFYVQKITSSEIIPYFSTNPPSIRNYERFIWLKLDNIQIKNSTGLLKSVSFSYIENSNERLKLSSLDLKGSNGAIVENYSFTYNQTKQPAYLKTYTDHWGFNNNIPAPNYSGSWNFEVNRSPDPTGLSTQAEVLTSIKYPTGGRTNFFYEPNTYSMVINRDINAVPVAENGIAGGLRIKRTVLTDCNNNSLVKNYYYVKNFRLGASVDQLISSGVLDSKPKYEFKNIGKDVSGSNFSYYTKSSSPVVPLTENSSGQIVGYSEVVETSSDGSYLIYKYSNHDNGYADVEPVRTYNRSTTGTFPYTTLHFIRGRLIDLASYSSEGKLVSRESMNYDRSQYLTTSAGRAVFSETFYSSRSGGRAIVSRAAYLNYYTPFNPVSKIVEEFDTDEKLIRSKTNLFEYNNLGLIKKNTWTESNDKTTVVTYKYPTDFVDNVSSGMTALNIVSPILEEKSETNGTWEAKYSTYFSPFAKMYVPQKIQTQRKGKALVNKYKFLRYDNYGNLLEIEENESSKTVFLWGYKGQYLVAKVDGMDYLSVDSLLSQGQIDNTIAGSPNQLKDLLNGLRVAASTRNGMVTSYTYKSNIGLESQTTPTNESLYYDYDAYGRLSTIRDDGGSITKTIDYNYTSVPCAMPTFYESGPLFNPFIKNNCTAGKTGTYLTYFVPAGKYISTVSKQDADNLAQQEIDRNGQNFANRYGECQSLGNIIFDVQQLSQSSSGSYFISIDGQDKTGFRGVPNYGLTSRVECGNVLLNSHATLKFTFLSVAPTSVKIYGFWGMKTVPVVGNVATFEDVNLGTAQSVNVSFN